MIIGRLQASLWCLPAATFPIYTRLLLCAGQLAMAVIVNCYRSSAAFVRVPALLSLRPAVRVLHCRSSPPDSAAASDCTIHRLSTVFGLAVGEVPCLLLWNTVSH